MMGDDSWFWLMMIDDSWASSWCFMKASDGERFLKMVNEEPKRRFWNEEKLKIWHEHTIAISSGGACHHSKAGWAIMWILVSAVRSMCLLISIFDLCVGHKHYPCCPCLYIVAGPVMALPFSAPRQPRSNCGFAPESASVTLENWAPLYSGCSLSQSHNHHSVFNSYLSVVVGYAHVPQYLLLNPPAYQPTYHITIAAKDP